MASIVFFESFENIIVEQDKKKKKKKSVIKPLFYSFELEV